MIGLIDVIIVILLTLSILFALYRGLVRELLGIAAWILSGIAALYSYEFMKKPMGYMIEDPTWAGISGALLMALIVLIIMTILNHHIAERLRRSALSGLDRTLGFVFGFLRGALLIAVLYIGASMVLSPHQMRHFERENISLPVVQRAAEIVLYAFPDSIKDDMKVHETDHPLPRPDLPNTVNEAVGQIKERAKKALPEPRTQPPTAPAYTPETRKSLDDMIEQIIDVKDL